MPKHEWKDEALCLEYDTNLFFDKYEDDELLRPAIDKLCSGCSVAKMCFAVGVSQKEWGIWGGVYLENGHISKEFSRHKNKSDWANTWQYLTMESE
jgi:signal transduction histidine kinase